MFGAYAEDWAELKSRLKVYGLSLLSAVCFFLVAPADFSQSYLGWLGFYRPLVGGFLLWVRDYVSPPGLQLTPGAPGDPLQVYFYAALFLGFLVTLPVLLWESYRFARPAFEDSPLPTGITAATAALFFAGCAFGFFLLLPWVWLGMVTFFPAAGVSVWYVSAMDFYQLAFMTTLVSGLCFTAPVWLYLAVSRLGLDPDALTSKRKYLWGVTYIFSAVVTPDSNFLADFVLFVPLIVMVELTLFLAKRGRRPEGPGSGELE